MTIRVQGRDIPGVGEVIADSKKAIAAFLLAYLNKAPHLAKYVRVALDLGGQPVPEDVVRVAQNNVIIRIQTSTGV